MIEGNIWVKSTYHNFYYNKKYDIILNIKAIFLFNPPFILSIDERLTMVNIQNKGIVVFDDKGKKFIGERHSLTNLTKDYDIIVGTQDKEGKPVSLTVEVSQAGTIDRDTFERKSDAPAMCEKMNYEKLSPRSLFGITMNLVYILKNNLEEGKTGKNYYVKSGFARKEISEADYHNIDFVM